MAVTVLSPVEGLQPGETYEGPNEKFLVENGYAKYKTRRKFDGNKPSGVEYEHPEVEAAEFVPTPTTRSEPVPAPETLIQAQSPAAPKAEKPADPTVRSEPEVAPETKLGN